jgi:hypothetical protein
MCQACEEMLLYYAYLEQLEEEKKKAQPWQCEVTLFPAEGEATAPKAPVSKKSGFACDETE